PGWQPPVDPEAATQEMPARQEEASPAPPPPPAAEATDEPLLTLARYAEIVVGLGGGDDKATIFARYELTETSWATNASAWAQRLQQDPQLLGQFHAHVQELRGRR